VRIIHHGIGRRRTRLRPRGARFAAVAAVAITLLTGCASVGPPQAAGTAPAAQVPTPSAPATASASPRPTPLQPTTPMPAQTPDTVSIGWVGDTAFGTVGATPPGGPAEVFSKVPSAALHADVMLANLETTLGDGLPMSKCAEGQADCYQFQAPTAAATALKNAGFAGVNVANNHTRDAGAAGVSATNAALAAAGLSYAGRPGQTSYLTRDGVTIALLGFAPYYFDDNALQIAAAQAQVRKAAAQADLVIVMTHLGAEGDGMTHVRPGEESYLGEDRGDPIAFSHAVIDAGADLVIGSGPHVLRGMEWYRGHLIAYSLGNFANYRNLPVTATSAVTAVLHVTLSADGRFVSGDVTPMRIAYPGLPQPDPSAAAVTAIGALSQADFGTSAVALTPAGGIAPPR
jgi:poly-gamma-glutamate capsule biosynthesis protein CapA/YwtB (metallophosphatase superfamily)